MKLLEDELVLFFTYSSMLLFERWRSTTIEQTITLQFDDNDYFIVFNYVTKATKFDLIYQLQY